eukprot:1110883-Rhodomonas_salina.2
MAVGVLLVSVVLGSYRGAVLVQSATASPLALSTLNGLCNELLQSHFPCPPPHRSCPLHASCAPCTAIKLTPDDGRRPEGYPKRTVTPTCQVQAWEACASLVRLRLSRRGRGPCRPRRASEQSEAWSVWDVFGGGRGHVPP